MHGPLVRDASDADAIMASSWRSSSLSIGSYLSSAGSGVQQTKGVPRTTLHDGMCKTATVRVQQPMGIVACRQVALPLQTVCCQVYCQAIVSLLLV